MEKNDGTYCPLSYLGLWIAIGSPIDTKDLRKVVREVCKDISRPNSFADELGVYLPVIGVEDIGPGRGRAQRRVSDGLKLERCWAFVCLFRSRYGSPAGSDFGGGTSGCDSGTVEELTRAIAQARASGYPHVLVYVSQDSRLGGADPEQVEKLMRLIQEFDADGSHPLLWSLVDGPEDLREQLRRDLESLLASERKWLDSCVTELRSIELPEPPTKRLKWCADDLVSLFSMEACRPIVDVGVVDSLLAALSDYLDTQSELLDQFERVGINQADRLSMARDWHSDFWRALDQLAQDKDTLRATAAGDKHLQMTTAADVLQSLQWRCSEISQRFERLRHENAEHDGEVDSGAVIEILARLETAELGSVKEQKLLELVHHKNQLCEALEYGDGYVDRSRWLATLFRYADVLIQDDRQPLEIDAPPILPLLSRLDGTNRFSKLKALIEQENPDLTLIPSAGSPDREIYSRTLVAAHSGPHVRIAAASLLDRDSVWLLVGRWNSDIATFDALGRTFVGKSKVDEEEAVASVAQALFFDAVFQRVLSALCEPSDADRAAAERLIEHSLSRFQILHMARYRRRFGELTRRLREPASRDDSPDLDGRGFDDSVAQALDVPEVCDVLPPKLAALPKSVQRILAAERPYTGFMAFSADSSVALPVLPHLCRVPLGRLLESPRFNRDLLHAVTQRPGCWDRPGVEDAILAHCHCPPAFARSRIVAQAKRGRVGFLRLLARNRKAAPEVRMMAGQYAARCR